MNYNLQSIMLDLKKGTDAQDHASLLCYHAFDDALHIKSYCWAFLKLSVACKCHSANNKFDVGVFCSDSLLLLGSPVLFAWHCLAFPICSFVIAAWATVVVAFEVFLFRSHRSTCVS